MPSWNTAITTVITNLRPGFVRQRLFHSNTQFMQMVNALTPTVRFIGMAGQLSDNESDVRAEIAAWRADPLSKYLDAITGCNEPNGNDTGFSTGGPGNTVRHQSWIWDEVVNGGAWTHRDGNARPLVIGPALKRAGFSGDDDTQYDADIAALAAATFGGHTIGSYLDGLDFHRYLGVNSPGTRVSNKDSSGATIPGIVLGSDNKCSLFTQEKARVNQVAPGKPVLYWTESGWTDSDGTPSGAQRALYAQETMLRAYAGGVSAALYETIDEYPLYGTREDYFGLWSLTTTDKHSAGAKPLYTALQTLTGYNGSASFTNVGWIEPLAGVNPDCGVLVFSKAAGGWDIYLLREGETTIDFVTAPTHSIIGKTATRTDSWGNRHYTLDLSGASMLVLQVI